jgi:hypothetical protein
VTTRGVAAAECRGEVAGDGDRGDGDRGGVDGAAVESAAGGAVLGTVNGIDGIGCSVSCKKS